MRTRATAVLASARVPTRRNLYSSIKFSLDNFFLNRQAKRTLKTKPEFGEGFYLIDLGDFIIRYQVIGEGDVTLVLCPDAPIPLSIIKT